MGYLNDKGVTYDYFESLAFQKMLKEKGIVQFLSLLKIFGKFQLHEHQFEHLSDPNVKQVETKMQLFWGDEFEGHVIKLYDDKKLALLNPNTSGLFQSLSEEQQKKLPFVILPEFGAWMIELTPNKPYQCMCFNFDQVLINMRKRIQTLQSYLPQGNQYVLIPVYPMLGVGRFTTTLESDLTASMIEKIRSQTSYIEGTPTLQQDEIQFQNEKLIQPATPYKELPVEPICNYFSQSIYFDDRIINPHPRYATLAQNIRLRRGSKVEIKIPLFIDQNTKIEQSEYEPNPGFITMDHMGFGMGNCALQTTYLSIDIDHARLLYDQLAVLAPLFAALTAGSPIYKGKISNWDTKWDCLEMSVDCRSENERNPKNPNHIPKSRYSTISYFISNDKMNLEEYNDLNFPANEEIMQFAKQKAQQMDIPLDQRLLRHLGILFLRDNMVMFKDKIHIDDNTAHFEAIQSSNWNSVRFKPPPSYNSKIGWRVEFRTMEIQLTAEENAAWSIMILMIVRLFFTKHIPVNFYMPLSLVDENMKRSKEKGAILNQKFYFRTNFQEFGPAIIEELYLKEIFFGKQDGSFIGIIGLIYQNRNIISTQQCSQKDEHIYQKNKKLQDEVIEFVKNKVYGNTKTLASWMRDFVISHPNYNQDSIVTHEINYDLIKALTAIKDRQKEDPHFPLIFSM
ncbi:unnamed protein product [Paramecium sonneborni]|uniref:Glutamate--cysteine ligase n=1 Tax=Paramecium sonneborni TaxID=65129 RepID=A0A8S1K655_9CILI|nr:unnamed protein product [Paramecium sonneborni]